MPRTIGYHLVFSDYGLWLPGDERGYWSEAWDEQLGFIEPHTLHAGDPIRKRMAEERQKHPRVVLDAAMRSAVIETIGKCRADFEWRIAAASVESTHIHLLPWPLSDSQWVAGSERSDGPEGSRTGPSRWSDPATLIPRLKL